MIITLGYISLYLIIGVVLLPYFAIAIQSDWKHPVLLFIAIIVWPIGTISSLLMIYEDGIKELKKYK